MEPSYAGPRLQLYIPSAAWRCAASNLNGLTKMGSNASTERLSPVPENWPMEA